MFYVDWRIEIIVTRRLLFKKTQQPNSSFDTLDVMQVETVLSYTCVCFLLAPPAKCNSYECTTFGFVPVPDASTKTCEASSCTEAECCALRANCGAFVCDGDGLQLKALATSILCLTSLSTSCTSELCCEAVGIRVRLDSRFVVFCLHFVLVLQFQMTLSDPVIQPV